MAVIGKNNTIYLKEIVALCDAVLVHVILTGDLASYCSLFHVAFSAYLTIA